MSGNRLEMEGLEEFRQALRQLPAELQAEATTIVRTAATNAKGQIVANYPEGPTGNLKAGVTVELNSTKFGSSGIVRSRAKHAWIFEHGTKQRRTAKGANRGAMPKAPESEAMIPIVVRARAAMVRELIALVKRAGFEVSTT